MACEAVKVDGYLTVHFFCYGKINPEGARAMFIGGKRTPPPFLKERNALTERAI
jgi:hypothetical protein